MSPTPPHDLIARVRRALGRTGPLVERPVSPEILEPVTRLVHSDIGLGELFAARAKQNKMDAELVTPEELSERIVKYLRARNCRTVVAGASPLLQRLNVERALAIAGFDVRRWEQVTPDELYDFDAALTDVYAAVAEVGGLVVRGSAAHGRALSLVPPVHVAVVEPKVILPDLVDLFDKLAADEPASFTSIITGPSKTADIEMNLVTGVHGPGHVGAFVLH